MGKAVSFGVNKESYRYDSSSLILTWRQRLISATHASISEVEAVPQNSRLFFRKPFISTNLFKISNTAMAYGGRSTYLLPQGSPRTPPTKDPTWAAKFCILCKEGGKSEATIASHDTVHCDTLSKSELRAMLAALQSMDLVPNNQDPEDDAAAEGLEHGYNYNDQGDQSQGLEPAGSS